MWAKGWSFEGGEGLILGTNIKNKDRVFLVIIKAAIKDNEREANLEGREKQVPTP